MQIQNWKSAEELAYTYAMEKWKQTMQFGSPSERKNFDMGKTVEEGRKLAEELMPGNNNEPNLGNFDDLYPKPGGAGRGAGSVGSFFKDF